MSFLSKVKYILPKFNTHEIFYAANTLSRSTDAQVCFKLSDIDVPNANLFGKGTVKYIHLYTLFFIYDSNILLSNGKVIDDIGLGFHFGFFIK